MTASGVRLGLLVAAAAVALSPSGAQASCVPHTLAIEPASAAAGATVTVRGEGWFIGCNDTGQGTREPADTAELSVLQDGRVFPLGQATADQDYRFSIDVRLPPGLSPGAATVLGQGKGGQAEAALQVTRAGELPLTGKGATSPALALTALAMAFICRRRLLRTGAGAS